MSERAFQSFTKGGVRYLAIPVEKGDVMVVDEAGNSYGSWWSVDRFKKEPRQAIGRVRVSFRVVNDG